MSLEAAVHISSCTLDAFACWQPRGVAPAARKAPAFLLRRNARVEGACVMEGLSISISHNTTSPLQAAREHVRPNASAYSYALPLRSTLHKVLSRDAPSDSYAYCPTWLSVMFGRWLLRTKMICSSTHTQTTCLIVNCDSAASLYVHT